VKLAWATDVHLTFVDEAVAAGLCDGMRADGAEALLLTGDIAEGRDVRRWLDLLAARLDRPVYFVLGNHDYYGSSIEAVRAGMRALADPRLVWLPAAGVVPLGPDLALVGVDGWGDARLGDFAASPVVLNDYVVIDELKAVWPDKAALAARLAELGDAEAAALRPLLAEALDRSRRVLVATHVPPFRGACWHQGELSNDDWLPGFTCHAVGEVLRGLAAARPDREVTVLCGHTHGEGTHQALPNLLVRTGGAEYGRPAYRILEV